MEEVNKESQDVWAKRFLQHREHLLNIARQKMNPMLLRRITPEDIVQEALKEACKKIYFFENKEEVPLFQKLLIILFQTITAMERKFLRSKMRDVYKEQEMVSGTINVGAGQMNWNFLADSLAGPHTQLAQNDRQRLMKSIIASMSENDRGILELRWLQGLSNDECAVRLDITAKTASIRHARALQRLQELLSQHSEFF